jgi:CRISPR system Cascade subunit CasE
MMMLMLSRLVLDPHSAAVRRDWLGSHGTPPYARTRVSAQLHRTLQSAFAADRAATGVLFRLEEVEAGPLVLVQSACEPDWRALPEGYLLAGPAGLALKRWAPEFATGQVLRFRLRANPVFKRGRRRLAWLTEEDQIAWLHRQTARGGAAVREVRARAEGFTRLRRRHDECITCYTVLYDGLLEVRQPADLVETLRAGIGSAKAFGCGLLSVG